MGKTNNAPQAPDPYATANAQTQSNKETAIAQTNLNSIDQVTPGGSLKYTQIGTNPDGTPKLQATTTLSTASQGLYDTGQQTAQTLANLGQDQAGKLSGLLSAPIDLSNDATEARLMELGRSRLDPALDRRRESAITRLSNQGIKLGSTAYDRAIEGVDHAENDAYNQLVLTGRNQAVSEAIAQRNQPINEIIGLTSGTQLQSPGFQNTPQSNVSGTDTAGIAQAGYANNYNSWLQQQNQQQQLLGGLFGLGSAAIMASERQLKTAIRKIGELANGLNVYRFRYKGRPETHTGFMADEVATVAPKALRWLPTGHMAVDLEMAMEAA
jgi:hypothetical protein